MRKQKGGGGEGASCSWNPDCDTGFKCCEIVPGAYKCVPKDNLCFDKKTPGGSRKKATKKRVKVGGNERVVYEGPRGGEYVKMNGGYVSLKQVKMTK
jgi:hypothetical protein